MAWLISSLLVYRSSAPEPTTAQRLIKAEQQRKYVRELWLFLTAVIALLAFIRVTRLLISLVLNPRLVTAQSSRNGKDSPRVRAPSQVGKISFRRLPYAFTTAFRIVAFRWTLPIGSSAIGSVSELTFVAGYIVVVFIWLLVDTQDLSVMFYEDRAAHLASCQLPLIVALAGKNNIISFITGIGHEKLNVLHRAAARTCLLLLWMHAISRTVTGLPEKFDFTHGWMICGATGLTAFSSAAALSVRFIRQNAFELFLVSHIVLVGIFLISGYFHVQVPGFGDYIWPALAVWASDRILRGGRLLYNNRAFGRSDSEYATATVELLSEDTVRLTLRRKFDWKAGQHAYITLPTISSLPTEAHPFTIASIPTAIDGNESSTDRDVVFLIQSRGGFTQRLRHYAASDKPGAITALVDGPYGCPSDLSRYSNCILIAGGSGISYTLPLLLDIIYNAQLGKSCVRRVSFVWAVRDGVHLSWASNLLTKALGSAPPSLVLEVQVYITGVNVHGVHAISDARRVPVESPMTQKTAPLEPPTYSAVNVTQGRPNILSLLQDEISTSSGPVSVNVAGPSGLSLSVRNALSSGPAGPFGVLRGMPPVTLHVENFGMAQG